MAWGGGGEKGVGWPTDDGLIVEGHALLGPGRHQFGAVDAAAAVVVFDEDGGRRGLGWCCPPWLP